MLSHAEQNKKSKKRLKKLSNWIGKLRSYALFEIGKNAKYSLEQLMDLPLAAALNNTSIEYVSTRMKIDHLLTISTTMPTTNLQRMPY